MRSPPRRSRSGIAPHEGDSWEDLFFRIFLAAIEPKLGIGVPTVLYDYPIAMAALARPKASDPTLCERFELYVCGLELANAFGELTDAAEQRRRFEADMAKKRELYGETYPIDEDFLAALAHGHAGKRGHRLGLRPAGDARFGRRRISTTCSGRRSSEPRLLLLQRIDPVVEADLHRRLIDEMPVEFAAGFERREVSRP